MKRLRKIIFWCHLLVGVTAGIIILIMSVTGVLLAYQRQIVNWADTHTYKITRPAADAQHLPVETLLAKVRDSQPNAAPAMITLQADPQAPAAVGVSGDRTVFVNPYTGDVLGEGSKKTRDFFRSVTDWHRWLGANGDNRTTARAITGVCNFGFLFIVTSGFYLWWPRKWNWSQVRNVIWFKRGLSGKPRDFNWHNTIGSWCVLPLFIVVLSGVVMSYTWANNLVYRIYGETPPAPRGAPGQPPPGEGRPQQRGEGGPSARGQREAEGPGVGSEGGPGARGPREAETPAAISFDGLNAMWARAEQQTADWQSINLRFPATADAPMVFTIDQGNGGQPQKRGQLTLDAKSGDIVKWEPFASYSSGRKARTWLRFAHTGEVGGWFGQTIAAIASLGGVMLVYTGLALAWRRLRRWQSWRANKPAYAGADSSNVTVKAGTASQSDA